MFVLSNRMWYTIEWNKQCVNWPALSFACRPFHNILMRKRIRNAHTNTALTITRFHFGKCTPIWHGCLRSSNSFILSPRNVDVRFVDASHISISSGAVPHIHCVPRNQDSVSIFQLTGFNYNVPTAQMNVSCWMVFVFNSMSGAFGDAALGGHNNVNCFLLIVIRIEFIWQFYKIAYVRDSIWPVLPSNRPSRSELVRVSIQFTEKNNNIV